MAVLLFLSGSVYAQPIWSETSALLTAPVTARAPYKAFYVDPITIRSGQQPLYFSTAGEEFIRMDVCIVTPTEDCANTSSSPGWVQLYGGPLTNQPKRWFGVPTSPGGYEVRLRYYKQDGSGSFADYDLGVVPNASRAFSASDAAGLNTMVLWPGTTADLDSPFLVVEGIDADNVNNEAAYYAIGNALFTRGRQRGADVLVLNFADGGRDMRLNAGVVKSAIQYLNQTKTGSRKLDVAGVSMGAVVTRYALAQMEQEGISHNVGRYVSMDGPQQGATLDGDLLGWMAYPPSWAQGNFDAPASVTGLAGKQLLTYNPFDTSSPNQFARFYTEMRAINGDGYPHLTVDNIGVSFGGASPNPNVGLEWLEIEADVVQNAHFYIEPNSGEAVPGSFLPRDVTDIGGVSLVKIPYLGIHFTVEAAFNLDIKSHPTFIPYTSAADIMGGHTKFTPPIIAPSTPGFHNVVPLEIVEPLLTRLGYPEPPFTASISGPSTRNVSQSGTWTASASNGVPPFTYRWDYRINYSFCSGSSPSAGDEGITTQGVPCGEWTYHGTGSTFTKSVNADAQMDILLTATNGWKTATAMKSVMIGSGAGGGLELTHTDIGAKVAGASALVDEDRLPGEYSLHPVTPNPMSGTGQIRYDLPKPSDVTLVVYDLLGREIVRFEEGTRRAGTHGVALNLNDYRGGVYVVRFQAGPFVSSQRFTIVR